MPKLTIKRGTAKSEYGGLHGWLRAKLDLAEDVSISVKSGGMYGNMKVVFTNEDGEEVECEAYFSNGITRYYKVSMWGDKKERVEGL